MAFVHRLVVVGFVFAALLAELVTPHSPRFDASMWVDITLLVGGGFAVFVYLMTWLFRGSLRTQ